MEELAALATIADPTVDEDVAWTAIIELHKAATRTVLERSIELTKVAEAKVRSRAVSVLGQLGIPARAFPDECLEALVELLEIERDEDVVDSTIIALGHLRHAAHLEAVTRFSTHKNPEIRHAVAFALGGRKEPEAVAALIALTDDPEAKVRDWATFGIGALGQVNTPEVCDALFERLQDADDDVRFEAVCGLANHGDKRGIRALVERLKIHPTDTELWQVAGGFLGEIPNEENSCVEDVIERLEGIA